MNKLTIIGNLTREPELRSTQDGTPVCGFTVAVNRPKTAKNPNPGADYFSVTAWRALGENCAKFLAKGRKVCVVGRVSVRTWETDNGKHGANLEVVAEDVEFLSSRNDAPAETTTPAGNTTPADPETGYTVVETDDLPF